MAESATLHRYRADAAALIAALTAAEMLSRYVATLEADSGSQAEAGQLGFTKRMLALVSRIGAYGVEAVAQHDRAGLDALLTDVFALATWHRWDLPVEDLGPGPVDPSAARRGLLGAEAEGQGAVLYRLDDEVLALRRWRDDDAVDLRDSLR